MTPKKAAKQKSHTLWYIAKSYIARFAAHRELVKRALFKWPKRILKDTEAKTHIIDKIKNIFWQISGSVWLLIASGVFLLYAAWSSFGPSTMTEIALHPAANDSVQDPIVAPIQTPTMLAPIANNENPPIENQEQTIQESIIETPALIVADTIQHIYTMYEAINDGSYSPTDYFDSYMQTSDLVKMYFTTKRLTTLRAAMDGDIRIISAEEFATDRRDRIGVRYVLNYTLTNTQKSFNETRAAILRPQAWGWRIGTMRCETWWCSVNPFFNMEKYGVK